jgi:hypothetical protein
VRIIDWWRDGGSRPPQGITLDLGTEPRVFLEFCQFALHLISLPFCLDFAQTGSQA